jgi:hypothetical protein
MTFAFVALTPKEEERVSSHWQRHLGTMGAFRSAWLQVFASIAPTGYRIGRM